MRSYQDPIALFLSTKVLQKAFTAADTDIVTCAAHGFVTGDKIRVTTSGADLPAGLATGTDYYIVKIDANTFYLSSTLSDSSTHRVDITDAGSGTHTLHLKSKQILVKDLDHITLSLATANSANFTTKIKTSEQDDVDFEAAASPTNNWTYVQLVNKEGGGTVDGNTGIQQLNAGTDEQKRFVVNVDMAVWIYAEISSWVAGTLTLKLSGTSKN